MSENGLSGPIFSEPVAFGISVNGSTSH
jgi:hypothetical protein